MIKSDFSTFIDAYKQASPEVKGLIDGPSIPDFVGNLAKQYPGVEKYRRDLIDVIADITLGLISLRPAMDDLRQGEETRNIFTQEVADQVSDFVGKVRSTQHVTEQLDEKPSQINNQINALELAAVSVHKKTEDEPAKTSPTTTASVIPFISEKTSEKPKAEASTKNEPVGNKSIVKPIRTFADDVALNRAHGYGAFQSGNTGNDDDEPIHRSNQDDIIKK